MITAYPNETNPLGSEDVQATLRQLEADGELLVNWTDPRLAKITRLRLLSDPGFPMWDVSYCYGQLQDGRLCRVQLPFHQLPKRAVSRAIVEHAKADGVYAKRLGIFGYGVISKLW